MQIEIITTGGTIDKVYFDAKSRFEVGEPQVRELLAEANLSLDISVTPLLRKDSLDMNDSDRETIRGAVVRSAAAHLVVTHGTDTMTLTARALSGIPDKTIVLTGAMQPARFRSTDAVYNLASALTAVQILPPGVWFAMNGRIFDPARVHKNVAMNRFEDD